MGKRIHYMAAARELDIDPDWLEQEIKAKRIPGKRMSRVTVADPDEVYEAIHGEPRPKPEFDLYAPDMQPMPEYVDDGDEVWQYPLKIDDMAVVMRNIRLHGEFPEHFDEFVKNLRKQAFDDPIQNGEPYIDWPISCQIRKAAACRTLLQLQRYIGAGIKPTAVRLPAGYGAGRRTTDQEPAQGSA